MSGIRNRRRQVQYLMEGPARAWPWVRASRYAFVAYIAPDPERERQEYLRELTALVPLAEGSPEPLRGEIGSFGSFRFVVSTPIEF